MSQPPNRQAPVLPANVPAASAADDDLDGLDDVLDDFDAPSSSAAAPAHTATVPKPSVEAASEDPDDADPAADDEDLYNGDFAKEFAAGMEALMREMSAGGAAGLGGEGATTTGALALGAAGPEMPPAPELDEAEMMKQFEAMMNDMGLGSAPGAPSAAGARSASASGPAAPPANFQDAIRQTMDRLRTSDSSAADAAGAAGGLGGMGGADLEKLMAALGGAEGADDPELAKMLENMMGELMSKEVLYEPLKELRDKYPPYLANAPATLAQADRVRYQEQARLVSQIVATLEDPDFENGSEARKRELKNTVQELMNDMQDAGNPPDEIVGDMPPELANIPGMGTGDDQCSVM